MIFDTKKKDNKASVNKDKALRAVDSDFTKADTNEDDGVSYRFVEADGSVNTSRDSFMIKIVGK